MTPKEKWIALNTILYKELKRVFRIWTQTLLPPAITTILYFIIFGQLIGSRIGLMEGYSYVQFIAPGLIMMSLINSAFASSVSSFFSAKFQKSIEEILVSPTPNWIMVLGFSGSGIIRGFIVGIEVAIISLFFTKIHIHSYFTVIFSGFIAACIFSLAGLINGIYAKKFDDIAIIPTFVLTPLIYLGGVFYSISLLPKTWYYISLLNPISYIIGNFRFGFLGLVHTNLFFSFIMMIFFTFLLLWLALFLVKRGVGLRE